MAKVLEDTLTCPTPCIFWGGVKKLSEEIEGGVEGLSYHQAGKPQGKLREDSEQSNAH